MTLQGTNAHLIGKGCNRLLFDAGQGATVYIDELKDTMKKNNIGLQEILITHWHPEHIYGIKYVLNLIDKRTTEFEDLYDYLNSLTLVLKMSPKRIYSGYCPVVENPQQTLEHYIFHRQQCNNQIFDAFKQSNDGLDPNEITKIVYMGTLIILFE
ncbi:unnamed protein product [Rotaria socialis]|uniref:Metallo-beta-lactamase domain-containing protein n=1 Tax=Rotaria socialis TaxID=392032 RepID=A0A821UBC1_9BILA|nr:unnamed protein product [Rotaria socialis]CAF4886947.1 unnamed protein product [Rotaria socialis]